MGKLSWYSTIFIIIGVKISDASLVTAAVLADRYISNRFLPDKAIDCVDEACANTRVQLDSQPEEIDVLERKKLQLEVEATALQKETDAASIARLAKVQQSLSAIHQELTPLKLKYEASKSKLNQVTALKAKLHALETKLADAERRHDLALAAGTPYLPLFFRYQVWRYP